jgi:hypothetical protein
VGGTHNGTKSGENKCCLVISSHTVYIFLNTDLRRACVECVRGTSEREVSIVRIRVYSTIIGELVQLKAKAPAYTRDCASTAAAREPDALAGCATGATARPPSARQTPLPRQPRRHTLRRHLHRRRLTTTQRILDWSTLSPSLRCAALYYAHSTRYIPAYSSMIAGGHQHAPPNVQPTTSATPFNSTNTCINTSAAATDDDAADDHDGRKHDHRSQTAAFARRWAGLAQTRRTGPVFKF